MTSSKVVENEKWSWPRNPIYYTTGNKQRVQKCRDNFLPNLNSFRDIKVTSQTVRNDMTNRQQMALTQRIISKRKQKEILHTKTWSGQKA